LDSLVFGVRVPALAIAATVLVGIAGPSRWRDTAGWRAVATSDAPPEHRLGCKNATGDEQAERAAHSLSTDSGAGGDMPGPLAWAEN
jgi:hypothetical protein